MASTYSANLKLELIGTGEQSGTWGTSTNTNLGTAVEQAIVGKGSPVFSSDADLTLTLSNSSSAQTARAFVLNVTSGVSLTATRNLVVPTIEKPYVVMNNTTGGQSIVVKTSAGSGITVPNGGQMFLYVDGTNVIQMLDAIGDLAYTGTLTGGTGVINIGSGQLVKDASGNVMLGGTPSAWAGGKAFEIGGTGLRASFFQSNSGVLSLAQNYYFNGAADVYAANGFATRYYQLNGAHFWNSAPSGTAGNPISFTQAMTLDASGNLCINGAPSANSKFEVRGSSSQTSATYAVGHASAPAGTIHLLGLSGISNGYTITKDGANNVTHIWENQSGEAMRIVSDKTVQMQGNLLVGTTSSGSFANRARFVAGANQQGPELQSVTVSYYGAMVTNTATSGDNLFVYFGTEANGGSQRGSIDYNRGGGVTRYNTSSDATLKNLIGDADPAKSLAVLKNTRLREYSWKDDPNSKPQIGVIAQEVHKVFKGAVSVGGEYEEEVPAVTEQRLASEAIPAVLDEDGNEVTPAVEAVYETVEITPATTVTKYRPWAVDKTAWTFHLVAGFQHQQAQIEAMQAQIGALAARLEALEGNA